MIVGPNAKLPGSTSVACWLLAFVKVSVLSLTSGTVAAGKLVGGVASNCLRDPEPHAGTSIRVARITKAAVTREVCDNEKTSPARIETATLSTAQGIEARISGQTTRPAPPNLG